MRLLYGHGLRLDGKYELNNIGQRLSNMLAKRVGEGNRSKRNGLKMHSDGLVYAVDLLRAANQWTAAMALIDAYGFSEQEFNEAEYAAAKMPS